MNQRNAVVSLVLSLREFDGPVVLTTQEKKICVDALMTGFKEGGIEMTPEAKRKYLGNDGELSKYCVGLLNNWVRKAPELNGGVRYEAKNPGSRAGVADETVRAMKALLKITTDPDAKQEIEAAINQRLAEIAPKPTINVDALPEHLKRFIR